MYERHGKLESGEYKSWSGMIQRCENPKSSSWHRYGGRGIIVCPEWRRSFLQFYKDMGPRPDGTSLDRIDNDKGYSKENCRWATMAEQANNKSNNLKLTRDGKPVTTSELAHIFDVPIWVIYEWVNEGWSGEDVPLSNNPNKNISGIHPNAIVCIGTLVNPDT